jgi:hypothetical protein
MKQIDVRVTIMLAMFYLVGCGTLSPRPDPSKFFTLSSSSQVEEAPTKDAGSAGKISLGIRPIKFPGYLDRQEIVLRSAQHRYEVSENDRWAEPLDENFTRVLGQNLSALLATDQIVSYPWPSDRKPNYHLEMEVLSFESNSAREARLSARWVVMDGGTKKPLNLKVSRVLRSAKENTIDGSVAALSESVAELSREIAGAIRAIDAGRK